jgi:hypothetical protein
VVGSQEFVERLAFVPPPSVVIRVAVAEVRTVPPAAAKASRAAFTRLPQPPRMYRYTERGPGRSPPSGLRASNADSRLNSGTPSAGNSLGATMRSARMPVYTARSFPDAKKRPMRSAAESGS